MFKKGWKKLWIWLNTPLFFYHKNFRSFEVTHFLRSDFNLDGVVNKLSVSKYNEIHFTSELARLYFMFFEKEQTLTLVLDRTKKETVLIFGYLETYPKEKLQEFYEYLPEGIFIFRNRSVVFR